ncbi:MAG: LysE family transporter [Alistipes sp.]|nr:LysE family transporter [Alistipes sp.]
MGVEVFLKGILIGLVASIPLGPIGVMCIQRTVGNNQRSGFVSGLGAATADTIFAAIALFSLTVVLSFIEKNLVIIQVLGGISVIIVGMTILLKNPVQQIRRNRAGKNSNLWGDYLSILLVTLANPAYILIFVALFAASGVSAEGAPYGNNVAMIVGVLSGTSIWWFLLTFFVNFLRRRFRPRHILWMNRISGTLIVVLGAAAILSIFFNAPVYEFFNR